jgi:LEA14-like dessication related protein
MKRAVLLSLLAVSAAGCTAPEPPKLTPISIAVNGVSATGLELAAKIAVENPNGYEITAQSMKAKVIVGGTVDLGTVNVDRAFTLPAKATTNLDVPLVVTWESAAPLLPLAQKAMVPYTVDGTVQFGGRITVTLPFHLEGVLKREQILGAAVLRLPLPR